LSRLKSRGAAGAMVSRQRNDAPARAEESWMIRSILCPVSGEAGDRAQLDLGAALARRFAAHVAVLHVKADPRDAAVYFGEGMSPGVIAEFLANAERDSEAHAARARAAYDAWARDAALEQSATPAATDIASCSWHLESGTEEKWIARLGRVADLTIVPVPGETGVGAMLAFEAALLDTGHGVLLAPPKPAGAADGPAVIAWNGSVEAARAVAAAMPLLATARSVHIVSIDEPGKPFDPSPLAAHLAWHRIAAELRAITRSERKTAEVLLDECRTLGAGLLVMGGYTHSRLREMVFGGVTQHLIRHAPLPVLMAH
jgi:nucleotide-binding universal stress UspA family protein